MKDLKNLRAIDTTKDRQKDDIYNKSDKLEETKKY